MVCHNHFSMTDVMPSGNINVEVTPANTLSNGLISYKGGSPIIQFIIGEQDRLLIGKSVRLCGQFNVRCDSTGAATDFIGPVGEAGVNAAGAELRLPARLGTYAMIDQLVIKSQATHQVIEHVRHYNRFAASFVPVTNSLADSKSHLAESSLIMPNYNVMRDSVAANPTSRANTNQQGNSFCMSLPCGLFNGMNDIPLARDWGLQGLLVEIHLAPDQNVLYDQTNAAAPLFTDAFYELSDVKLVAEMVNPDQNMLAEYSTQGNTFEYNTISSYFSSINSTNAIINFQLGMRRVLGVFANFIGSEEINSLRWNGTATAPMKNVLAGPGLGRVANINQAVFTRGGTRYPLEYNLDTSQRDDTIAPIQRQDTVDSQLTRNFLNAVKSFQNLNRSGITSRNTWLSNHQAVNQLQADKTAAEGGNVYGIGMAYDNISGDGVDFSELNWGVQLECGLDTNRPHAMYLFVHSKNTLVFNSTGLQIIQ
jgi:hypothetical protein